MKTLSFLSIIATSFLLASCTTTKTFTINSKSGTKTQGTVKFTQKKKVVEMDINVYKLTPGVHAIHIHEFGDCSASDGSSAGGHWNPSGDMHGKWDKEHFHMGDIGNLIADDEGTARLVFKTDKWCMKCKDEKKTLWGNPSLSMKNMMIFELNQQEMLVEELVV